jgi:GDPmannose 4,6-dehydratase
VQKKFALILGGSGQDGAFLAEAFLTHDVDVHSISREFSSRISALQINQTQLDLTSEVDIQQILFEIDPDIVVNLVSLSSVAACEKNPSMSEEINYKLVQKLVYEIEKFAHRKSKRVHFLQASSSEMYGLGNEFCNEHTDMNPVTTYGKHKLLSHDFLVNRRDQFVRFTSVILFNHESEFRPEDFVSSKVVRAAAEVATYGSTELEFGNILSQRDWGYAGDYMTAFARIALEGTQNCYVVSSSVLNSVEDMIKVAFNCVGISDYQKFIKLNQAHIRSIETPPIRGDNTRCKNEFDWSATLSFENLVQKMVLHRLREMEEKNV